MNEVIEKMRISSFSQNAEGVFYLLISTWALNSFLSVGYVTAFAGAFAIVAFLVIRDSFRFIAEAKNDAKMGIIDQLEADLTAKAAQISAIKTANEKQTEQFISQISASEAQMEILQTQNSAYASQMQKAALQISAAVAQNEMFEEAEKHNAALREKGKTYERIVARAENEGWDEAKLNRWFFEDFSESKKNSCLQKTIQNSIAKMRGGENGIS